MILVYLKVKILSKHNCEQNIIETEFENLTLIASHDPNEDLFSNLVTTYGSV